MTDHEHQERMAYRLGTRSPCCDRVLRHVDRSRLLCRGCGVIYSDVTAALLAAFPGAVDVTSMTPDRFLRGGRDAIVP